MKALGRLDQRAGLTFDQAQPVGFRLGEVGQLAIAAQLELAEFTGKEGAVVEQPGDRVHHPRGGAQRLARKRDRRLVVGFLPVEPTGQGKGRTHLVRKDQGFAVQTFDDPGIDACRACHDPDSDRLAACRLPTGPGGLCHTISGLSRLRALLTSLTGAPIASAIGLHHRPAPPPDHP